MVSEDTEVTTHANGVFETLDYIALILWLPGIAPNRSDGRARRVAVWKCNGRCKKSKKVRDVNGKSVKYCSNRPDSYC